MGTKVKKTRAKNAFNSYLFGKKSGDPFIIISGLRKSKIIINSEETYISIVSEKIASNAKALERFVEIYARTGKYHVPIFESINRIAGKVFDYWKIELKREGIYNLVKENIENKDKTRCQLGIMLILYAYWEKLLEDYEIRRLLGDKDKIAVVEAEALEPIELLALYSKRRQELMTVVESIAGCNKRFKPIEANYVSELGRRKDSLLQAAEKNAVVVRALDKAEKRITELEGKEKAYLNTLKDNLSEIAKLKTDNITALSKRDAGRIRLVRLVSRTRADLENTKSAIEFVPPSLNAAKSNIERILGLIAEEEKWLKSE